MLTLLTRNHKNSMENFSNAKKVLRREQEEGLHLSIDDIRLTLQEFKGEDEKD